MPSLPDPAIDERYEELAALVRASKPRASAELRERVLTLVPPEPQPRTARFNLGWRPSLVLVPAALVAIVAGAAIVGTRGLTGDAEVVSQPTVSKQIETEGRDGVFSQQAQPPERAQAGDEDKTAPSAALPPSRTRAQDFRAELRVRVRNLTELSRATARAMRVARSLGGFVVLAQYDAPGGKDGDSVLVVRVPVQKVQTAILRFAELGTIVGQQIRIEDLQRTINQQTESIQALRRTVATLERELERTDLTAVERARLRQRLLRAKDQLAARLGSRSATTQQAATARISLTLTTRTNVEPVVPEQPGYFERTVRDAASALSKVLAWALAVLIVAGPFLVLLAVGVALERSRRRRADERLLERA